MSESKASPKFLVASKAFVLMGGAIATHLRGSVDVESI